MRKIIDIFIIVLIFFVLYFLQANFFSWFNISGIMPNLFIIFIMIIGLYMKKNYGLIFGIVFGALLDFFIEAKIGMSLIPLVIIGLISDCLDKHFSKENKITLIIIAFLLTLIFEILTYILKIVLTGIATIELLNFIKIIIIEALFNAILIIILYPLICRFGKKLEEDFTGNKSFLNFY